MERVSLVTGAGRGIGKAIAIAFACSGIKVCCVARTIQGIDNTVKEIENSGGEAISYACDVSKYEEIKAAFKYANERYGAIDIVVINAGTDCKKVPIEELEIEEWKRVIDVNLSGAFYTAKAAIPYLKQSVGGRIITIGSGMGHRGRANGAPYNCSKSGLWMLTRTLAQELIQYGISVNELIPGPVNTDMGIESKKDNKSAFFIDGEWIKLPEDVTELALFLATQHNIGPTAQSFSLMRREL